MPLELDHVFICVEDPLSAEHALADLGFQFSRRGVHRGQGTANACAVFDNAYLELLWRNNDDELQSDVVRPLGLWERMHWRETGASPFGVAFRPDGAFEIETWLYAAPFLPPGASIPIVTPRFQTKEPLVFLSLVSQAPASMPPERRPPLQHLGRNRTLSAVIAHGPVLSGPSPVLNHLHDINVFAMKAAEESYLELVWDRGDAVQRYDLRPSLPLLLYW